MSARRWSRAWEPAPRTVVCTCPACHAFHEVPADVAPFREEDRLRVLCPSCGRRESREVWLPSLESSEALLEQRKTWRRRRKQDAENLGQGVCNAHAVMIR